MVEDRVMDGTRIAQLLASELDGREDDGLDRVTIANAAPDIDPTVDGALAYEVAVDDDPIAAVYVHPDRVRIEFQTDREVALEAAREGELHTRPKAGSSPRTIAFVESGAEVKRAVGTVVAVVTAEDG